MTPRRWSRIREIFGAVFERPEGERASFLDAACEGDAELRAEVEQLLAGNEEPSWPSPAAEMFRATSELASGDTVAHYRIEAKLGEGGMGAVYRAYDTRLLRNVALKVLRPECLADASLRRRLMGEARAASALNHPGIVTVYEVGCEGTVDFIAMEYVGGQPLDHVIPAGGLPLARALKYAIETAAALAKAHAAGIIHRDLKPGNIMLTGDDEIKLLDFGLALGAPRAEEEVDPVTGVGQISGTIGYMSPEQVRGLPSNHQTDLFSFGVVLYEMITGRRPFAGNSAMAVCDAILHAPPRDFGDSAVPARLKVIVGKLLEKDRNNRHGDAGEVRRELQGLADSLATSPVKLSRNAWIGVGAGVVFACVLLGWLWYRSSHERWARDTAMPAIVRLVDNGEYVRAAVLIREARAVLPNEAVLEKLWMRASGEVSIDSSPPGANIAIRPYGGDPNAWRALGSTPLKRVRVPRGAYVWRVIKPGFAAVLLIGEPAAESSPGFSSNFGWTLKLRPARAVPPEMVVVPGGTIALGYPIGTGLLVRISDFLIDRHEVTNGEYKKFVDAGAYQKREFWKQPFTKNGRTLSWEDAVALFHDATGRPGPATWEVGVYPKGQEKYPVAGVSWYEAGAYAEFAGKSLPTAYHWTLASQSTGYTPLIAAGSNFGHEGTRTVGSEGALSGFGTTDMAGNVKEWCWNEAREGRRFILGGSFGEPEYMFHHTDAQSPWDRLPNFGFRCVKLDSPLTAIAAAHIEASNRDYWKEKPVGDEVFKALAGLYAYDKGDLNARAEPTVAMESWSRTKVTFDAAYGHERVTAYLFVPNHPTPPLQTVVYFPGAGAFAEDKLDLARVEDSNDFLLKSGRALIVPIYKGMYERRDGYVVGRVTPAFFRDHVIAWSKDLRRSLDYLETRKEFDLTKVAYFGASLGAAEAPIQSAIEPRIKTAILLAGGFQPTRLALPEVEPLNFAPRMAIPVLMLNGRYDSTFPLESSQNPLFHFIGTPDRDKKHVVYEGGHGAFPRPDAVRECLDWLDKYLGRSERLLP